MGNTETHEDIIISTESYKEIREDIFRETTENYKDIRNVSDIQSQRLEVLYEATTENYPRTSGKLPRENLIEHDLEEIYRDTLALFDLSDIQKTSKGEYRIPGECDKSRDFLLFLIFTVTPIVRVTQVTISPLEFPGLALVTASSHRDEAYSGQRKLRPGLLILILMSSVCQVGENISLRSI